MRKHAPESAIYLNVLIVAIGCEPDELIGSQQTAEICRCRHCWMGHDHSSSMINPDRYPFTLTVLAEYPTSRSLENRYARCRTITCAASKSSALDDWLKYSIGPDPHLGAVMNPFSFEFEGGAVPNVVANVLLIDQNLVDGAAGPGPPEVGSNPAGVKQLGDFALELPIVDECPINPTDRILFFWWPWHQDDSIRLDAFLLPLVGRPLTSPLINQPAAQPKSRRAALAIAEFD